MCQAWQHEWEAKSIAKYCFTNDEEWVGVAMPTAEQLTTHVSLVLSLVKPVNVKFPSLWCLLVYKLTLAGAAQPCALLDHTLAHCHARFAAPTAGTWVDIERERERDL